MVKRLVVCEIDGETIWKVCSIQRNKVVVFERFCDKKKNVVETWEWTNVEDSAEPADPPGIKVQVTLTFRFTPSPADIETAFADYVDGPLAPPVLYETDLDDARVIATRPVPADASTPVEPGLSAGVPEAMALAQTQQHQLCRAEQQDHCRALLESVWATASASKVTPTMLKEPEPRPQPGAAAGSDLAAASKTRLPLTYTWQSASCRMSAKTASKIGRACDVDTLAKAFGNSLVSWQRLTKSQKTTAGQDGRPAISRPDIYSVSDFMKRLCGYGGPIRNPIITQAPLPTHPDCVRLYGRPLSSELDGSPVFIATSLRPKSTENLTYWHREWMAEGLYWPNAGMANGKKTPSGNPVFLRDVSCHPFAGGLYMRIPALWDREDPRFMEMQATLYRRQACDDVVDTGDKIYNQMLEFLGVKFTWLPGQCSPFHSASVSTAAPGAGSLRSQGKIVQKMLKSPVLADLAWTQNSPAIDALTNNFTQSNGDCFDGSYIPGHLCITFGHVIVSAKAAACRAALRKAFA